MENDWKDEYRVYKLNGLTSNEVKERRLKFGINEIVSTKLDSQIHQLLHILADPMGLMLLGLGLIYWLMGNHKDALILFVSYIPVTAVDVILELRAKKALKAMSSILKSTTKVFRNNKIIEINIKELVPDDLILFEEGQALPADGEIIECDQLQINEAALTGESLPIEKKLNDPFLCGTTIIAGRGVGKVTAIGGLTKFGVISQLIADASNESSPLEIKINGIIKKVIFVAVVLAALLFVITYLNSKIFSTSLIQSLTFGMAAIPEEFPIVFTLYLSMGAYRLSKHGVLVKSLPSVETLGNVDVICTDKTGTLTEGHFQLEKIELIDSSFTSEEVWQLALMACEIKPLDSMDKAIFVKGSNFISSLTSFSLKWDYPFEVSGKHMTHVWQNKNDNKTIIAMKGSVEGVIEHCEINDENLKNVNARIEYWAQKGKRILALAGKYHQSSGDRQSDETNLVFAGLCIFSDPIRSTAKLAIEECQKNGIEVKMLTGDHPITAHAIADELNIIHRHEVMFTGDQLLKMNQEERQSAFLTGTIFSRVLPKQKYEMVETLKRNGKVVAMTGDGINDAPALKIADIGISMGESATDVARSSAKMILMKNDFNGIVEAIFEGRRVFSNLKRSFAYLISFHIPIILFAFIPPLFGSKNILLPIHIVLLELVVHPVSAFSFENLPAANVVGDKTLMTKKRFIESFSSGFLLSLGSLMLFMLDQNKSDIIHARSTAITTLMLGNIFFVFIETYPIKSMRFIYSSMGLLLFTLALLYVPSLSKIFYLKPISLIEFGQCLGVCFFAALPSFLMVNKTKFYQKA